MRVHEVSQFKQQTKLMLSDIQETEKELAQSTTVFQKTSPLNKEVEASSEVGTVVKQYDHSFLTDKSKVMTGTDTSIN